MTRILKLWLPLAAFITACSPIEIGENMGAWIEVPPPSTLPTTTTTTTTTIPSPVAAGDLIWSNDALGAPAEASPAAAVRAVADRGRPTDTMIQASRFEVAMALPGIRFPSILPVGVTHVSSQLILQSGQLGPGDVAAFGLWRAEPYTQPRPVAQAGTLFVETAGDGTPSCAANAEGDVCYEFETTAGLVLQVQQGDSATWVWQVAGYRYRLFLRVVDSNLASAMIETAAPLEELGAASTNP